MNSGSLHLRPARYCRSGVFFECLCAAESRNNAEGNKEEPHESTSDGRNFEGFNQVEVARQKLIVISRRALLHFDRRLMARLI